MVIKSKQLAIVYWLLGVHWYVWGVVEIRWGFIGDISGVERRYVGRVWGVMGYRQVHETRWRMNIGYRERCVQG